MSGWDYVIVGAGSAGCVLAHRLSTDPRNRVLLLEAGSRDRSPYLHVPAGLVRAIGNPRFDWCYLAEPDPSRRSRTDLWPAGRVLGGSSSINGMLFVRGAPRDFDQWASLGNDGWGYRDVLPYFRRLERTVLGDLAYRGRHGPLRVEPLRTTHPLAGVFLDAAAEAGIPLNADYNGADQEGVAPPQLTQRRGWRWSAARAYLDPVRRRPNLCIETGAQVTRLRFEGRRCVGVEYRQGDRLHDATAEVEVVLAAGAIGSPRLLLLSGVGASRTLAELGLPVVLDNPAVGENLCEHPEAMVSVDVDVPTYNVEITPARMPGHLANWLLFGRGPATSPYPHAVGFLRSRAERPYPDLQVMLGPFAFTLGETGIVPYDRPAVTAAVNISYPRTRGRVTLRSADPFAPPRIEHALLSNEEDIEDLIRGAERCRQILRMPAFARHVLRERMPGPGVTTRDEWCDYLERTTFLGYHPMGTCRMGPTGDDGAVVDADLRLRGVQGLRVVDASVIPTPISGNTNAATLMIAERAAELISESRASPAGKGRIS